MKQKFNSILSHSPPHLAVKFGKYIKACLVKFSNLTTRWGSNATKMPIFWLHPPPTSLEAYSLLYLYLYSSVNWPCQDIEENPTRGCVRIVGIRPTHQQSKNRVSPDVLCVEEGVPVLGIVDSGLKKSEKHLRKYQSYFNRPEKDRPF
jgi:hypothetical protein